MSDGQAVRERMIVAAQELVSMRGFGVTLLDVVARAKTPRGSIYYYFPEGKEQLFREAISRTSDELEALVAAKARKYEDIEGFLSALVTHHTRRLTASGYDEGCPLVALTTSSDLDTSELRDVVQSAFAAWTNAIARELAARGLTETDSATYASVFVSAIEGAIVISRARKSEAALIHVKTMVGVIARAAAPIVV